MIDKLKELKKKNKALYYIGLPLLGILLLVTAIAKIMGDFNISKAKEDIKNTQNKDFDLEREQKEAERKAKELIAEADGHGDKADEAEKKANEAEADLDWHKNLED
mgnify:CR=1 FL=1